MGRDYVSELRPPTGLLFIRADDIHIYIYKYGERRSKDDTDKGNGRTRRKPCLSATLSTTNPTWTDQVANPGLRGERPATNRLSHATAPINLTFHLLHIENSLFLHSSCHKDYFNRRQRVLRYHGNRLQHQGTAEYALEELKADVLLY
jgi:hypothetical protein